MICDVPQLSILIPAKNEVGSLKFVIQSLIALGDEHIREILIVVDSKEDKTLKLEPTFFSNKKINFLVNVNGQGVFNAINFGVSQARSQHILILTADEIMPLLALENFVEALLTNQFVSATRYGGRGKRYGGNKLGSFLSRVANKTLSICYGGRVTDLTTGIKGFERILWEQISDNADGEGWSCALKFSLNALKQELSYAEIPIISVDRPLDGKSSFQAQSWIPAYLRKLIGEFK
jgi:glycosyltransferase involved in cell wall biosynthesis